jgi:Protein of unknown function DUF262
MTRPFRIALLEANSVTEVWSLWKTIDFKPSYQRQSDAWEKVKRQLFIDSLINGYDIPKLYFHDLSWDTKGPNRRYAIIDGKQRLEAIEHFINGKFGLSDEFEDIEEDDPETARVAAGMRYNDLASKYPGLKARFDLAQLPIVLVQTRGKTAQDLEVIEEMFSRLNEAVPLNAPEKRNALGGPLPKQIRRLAREPFFVSNLGFPNSRYRHLDLATKFLYIEYRDGLADLKKRDLDEFVQLFKTQSLTAKAAQLHEKASSVVKKMSGIFRSPDPLLASVGMVTIYYALVRDAMEKKWLGDITRSALLKFEDAREQNRARVREINELTLQGKVPPLGLAVNPVLSQFERYVQSPNDVTALTKRFELLRRSLQGGKIPAIE